MSFSTPLVHSSQIIQTSVDHVPQITLIAFFWILSNSSHSTLIVVPKNMPCISFKQPLTPLTSQPTHCFMLQAKHIQMILSGAQNRFILN